MNQPFCIRPFRPADQSAVEVLVLDIQRNEFGLALSASNQPDLKNIGTFFSSAKSAFWVAEDPQSLQIIGCLGLEALPEQRAVMRKFMVHPNWRGKAAGVALALNDAFESHARDEGVTQIVLSTVEPTKAAQRFYLRMGYETLERSDLPKAFAPGVLDTIFFSKAATGRKRNSTAFTSQDRPSTG